MNIFTTTTQSKKTWYWLMCPTDLVPQMDQRLKSLGVYFRSKERLLAPQGQVGFAYNLLQSDWDKINSLSKIDLYQELGFEFQICK